MPGEDFQSWSKTAASNGNADTGINWAEGMPRASVNDSARSVMAALAKDRDLKNGSITTGGSANAQTFSSGVGYTSLPAGLQARLKIGFTNTGSTTLNVDGIAAVTIKRQDGNNLAGGELVANTYSDFLFNGTAWILLNPQSPETTQVFLSGSGTYTTPTGVRCLEVLMVGGGGGGGGGNNGSVSSAGGSTTFGSLTAAGGNGSNSGGPGGAGGSASGGTFGVAGGGGASGTAGDTNHAGTGGVGGGSAFGGAGAGNYNGAGGNAAANSGAGGGGGGCGAVPGIAGGGGGGAGGFVFAVLPSPAATYAYSVGGGALGGAGGSNAFAGGNGGAGMIVVKQYFKF